MKQLLSSIIMISGGLVLLIGQASGVDFLSNLVLRGTSLNFGWVLLGIGMVTGLINLIKMNRSV